MGDDVAAERLTERLAAIAGADHVARPGPDALPHAGIASPALRVAPETLEQAALALAACRAVGAPVVPWGGGTQQRIGRPPRAPYVALDTTRMRAVTAWEPADLTTGVQAGATLGAVQAALAKQGQQLTIDAPVPERATIGGLIATNTSGPRRWLFGGWRDVVVGMAAAQTDGQVINSGGRVVKNVQGYDLAKLFIGSLGTLGLVGQVFVKLAPLPATRRIVGLAGDLDAVGRCAAAVAAAPLRLSAIDLLGDAALTACGVALGPFAVLALVEGERTVVDAQTLALMRQATDAGLRTDVIDGGEFDRGWGAWVNLGRTDDLSAHEALLTVSARPSDAVEAVHAAERHAAERGLAARVWARAGNGAVYVRLSAADAASAPALAQVQAALLTRWPATTLVAGDPAGGAAAQPWGADPEGLALMRTLKRGFDPSATLQPGRFVGGI
ncbi:MAG: FAD-binding oxidoreductase [Dehalococcoidia bacterium]